MGEPAGPAPGPRRIGVLGGTFDPPHYGHLAIAEEARCALALERVLVVPAGRPPHKPGKPITPAAHRVAMLELAIAGNPALILSRADLDRPGPSYTAGLLERLRGEWGDETELYFVVGMDSLRDFLTWKHPARILALARMAAVGRPGCQADLSAVETAIPGALARITVLEGPGLEIASSDLQRRVRAGLPIRYQTPDAVVKYIAQHGLYRGAVP